MSEIDATTAQVTDEIIAQPETGYRWKHLIVGFAGIALGCWFAYDGWIKWPNTNQRIEQIQKDKDAAQAANDNAKVEELAKQLGSLKKHTDLDILIQKVLAFTLPAFGIFWGAWTLYETRGRYRMIGNTLEVPGHPPITYDNIRRIDKRKWDRKGVAFLHYELGAPPQPGVLKLDDFAYERRATDEILAQIEKNLLPSMPTMKSPPAVERPTETQETT
jgi:hypothetical protein